MLKKSFVKKLFIYSILIFPFYLFSAKVGVLNGILKPQMIKVYDNELFVVEGHKIFIYSLNNLKLKKIIGKSGEGPEEFKIDPARTLIINVFKEHIVAESRTKVIFFTRTGEFIREMKKNRTILQIIPVKNNFLIFKIDYSKYGKNYFVLHLYNSEMEKIKELFKQKFFSYENKLFVMPDSLNYCVDDNKIYIEKSIEGFKVDIYDSEGNKIDHLERTYNKVPVPETKKKNALKEYLNNPAIVNAKKRRGEAFVNQYIKSLKLIYPDFYPAIKYITSNNNNIYFQTSENKLNQIKYIIYDINNKKYKETYLPEVKKVDFLVQMQGDKKFFSIFNNKFYYLKYIETEDGEDWELHSKNM